MVLEKTPAPDETAIGAQDVARETLRSAAARRAGVGGTRREKSKNSAARARFMFFAFRPLKIAPPPPPVPPHPPPIVSRVCRWRRRQRGTRGNSFYGTPARMPWARRRVTPTEKRRRYAYYMYARASYFVLLLFLKASRRPVRTISASNTTTRPAFSTFFFFVPTEKSRVRFSFSDPAEFPSVDRRFGLVAGPLYPSSALAVFSSPRYETADASTGFSLGTPTSRKPSPFPEFH